MSSISKEPPAATQSALIPDVDDAPVVDQEHQEARRLFEHLAEREGFPWARQYGELLGRGYYWRKAAVIAWMCMPKDKRQPPYQKDLADLLACSEATIKKYKDQVDSQTIVLVSRSKLLQHLADVDEALIQVASSPDYKSARDRELFYKRTGVLQEEQVIRVGHADPVENLSDAELARLAGLGQGDDEEE